MVLSVNAATINVEPTSTTLYRPVTSSTAPDAVMPTSSASRDRLKFIVSKMSTQPPMSPATWNTSPRYMNSQNQSSHDTRRRGPGTEFSASSVVMRSTIARRASSICTNTLTMHARRMNQSIEKPSAAPTFGVTISSPDPTIAALMMRPGPDATPCPPSVGGGIVGYAPRREAEAAT